MLNVLPRGSRTMLNYDASVAWSALLLCSFGLVMVYSASIATAEASKFTGYNSAYFLLRQAGFVAVGLIAATVTFQIPIKRWQRLAPYLFLAGVVLLVLVLIPGIGRAVNGSRRWIPMFIVNLQPSEFMKFLAVLFAANYTVRKAGVLHRDQPLKDSIVKGFLPLFTVMMLVGWLVLREPDFGAFTVILALALGILFLGGLDLRLVASLLLLVPIGLGVLIWIVPYRLHRLAGFLDPWADPFHTGYQLSQARIAFGRGEWVGVGLGSSVEKLFYLPEAHTDFLLAVIAEELGFIGVLMVIALYAWLITRAFAIGRQAARLEKPYAALVAQGIGLWLGVQTLINMGVNMGVLPTKGLTLPLVSYGGSGLVANCIAVAVLMRVDWENRRLLRGFVV